LRVVNTIEVIRLAWGHLDQVNAAGRPYAASVVRYWTKADKIKKT
jgi:hypothetical protein